MRIFLGINELGTRVNVRSRGHAIFSMWYKTKSSHIYSSWTTISLIYYPVCSLNFLHWTITMLSFITSIALLLLAPFASATTVTYNWDVSWINANPDGRLVRYCYTRPNPLLYWQVFRPVIAINGQFTPPLVSGNVGDQIVVNVNNKLRNESMTGKFLIFRSSTLQNRRF